MERKLVRPVGWVKWQQTQETGLTGQQGVGILLTPEVVWHLSGRLSVRGTPWPLYRGQTGVQGKRVVKRHRWDFPGGPVVKALYFHCRVGV